jgi:hypothetical protein
MLHFTWYIYIYICIYAYVFDCLGGVFEILRTLIMRVFIHWGPVSTMMSLCLLLCQWAHV